jgi:putative ABC transport system permease protein
MAVHYILIAFYSFKRTKVMTGVMVLAIAFGIACSTAMFTVLQNIAGDPLPERSAFLFHPQIDPRPAMQDTQVAAPPDNMTYLDAMNLLKIGDPGIPKVAMSSNWLPAKPDRGNADLVMFTTRATTANFFSMFGVPFIYGGSWSSSDDEEHRPYVVLSRRMNDQLFNGKNSVGETLLVGKNAFKIVGVIDDWNPQPHFYDLDGNKTAAFGDAEQMYMPFTTWIDQPQDYGYGPMQCWGADRSAGDRNPKAPNCTWVQFWVQLRSKAQVQYYKEVLTAYSAQQHQLGRFGRSPNVRLLDLMGWLNYRHVVPPVVRMQLWISLSVLLVCLLNTVGLLAAKFQRKSGELGLRRALGASRRDIFIQCLIESSSVGLIGGLLSMPLSWLGLQLLRAQPLKFASAIHLDISMLVFAIALAVLATALCGVWPSWRASLISPSLQVKSL